MHDTEILQAAQELFMYGNYPSVVAVCSDVLAEDSDDIAMRLLLARALIALSRNEEAQEQLTYCLQVEPACAEAYQLLGELAVQRDQLADAEAYFREAIRKNPQYSDAHDHLNSLPFVNQSTAAVEKLPAAAVAVGCTLSSTSAQWTGRRFALGSESDVTTETNLRPLRGFGDYLVRIGVLSTAELERAMAHHQGHGVRIGTAVVELGFASEPKVEWAALAYHSKRR